MHATRKPTPVHRWQTMSRDSFLGASPHLGCAVSIFLACVCCCFDASSVERMVAREEAHRQHRTSISMWHCRGSSIVPRLLFGRLGGRNVEPAVFGIGTLRQNFRLRGGWQEGEYNGEDIGTSTALGYHKLPQPASDRSESSYGDEEPSASSSSVSVINEEELQKRKDTLEEEEERKETLKEEEERLAQERYVEEVKRTDQDRKAFELESAYSMPTAEEEDEALARERTLADILTESQLPSDIDDDALSMRSPSRLVPAASAPTAAQLEQPGGGEEEEEEEEEEGVRSAKRARVESVRMGSADDRRGLPLQFSERWLRSPRPEAETHQVPGALYSDLKLALAGVKGHGTQLHLGAGEHGPFLVEHDYPEEADHETEAPSAEAPGTDDKRFRVWADPLYMLVPCHLIGTPSTRLHGSVSIVCGTLGVGPCRISDIAWTAHRESCLHIFGGQWQLLECDLRTNHPAGDAIFCRGTSKIPLPRRRRRESDMTPAPLKFAKFPLVTLHLDKCGLGGMREGVPAGWGVMVVERAEMEMRNCRVEFTHQAIGVVDWCSAFIESSSLVHNGNALWFGNKCDVQLSNCDIREVIAAFSLRNMWDRGTKCCDTEQVSSPLPVFEGKRVPGTFTNQSCTFSVPETAIDSSSVRPPLPFIKDPFTYHMKNLRRDDLSGIKTFGADPRLRRPNPDFREGEASEQKEKGPRGRFQELHKHAADLAEEGPFKDPKPTTYSIL